MWKPEHRRAAERPGLRYPSDLTDAEWALVAPLIPPARRGGRPRDVNVREVLNAIFYVLSTGCQWKALPKDLVAIGRIELDQAGAPALRGRASELQGGRRVHPISLGIPLLGPDPMNGYSAICRRFNLARGTQILWIDFYSTHDLLLE